MGGRARNSPPKVIPRPKVSQKRNAPKGSAQSPPQAATSKPQPKPRAFYHEWWEKGRLTEQDPMEWIEEAQGELFPDPTPP